MQKVKKAKKIKEIGDDLRMRAEKKLKSLTITTVANSNINIHAVVHELEVQKIELEMQNEELRNVQHMLEKSHRNYVGFYDFAPIGFLSLTKEGEIVNANLMASDLLGVERNLLINTKIYNYLDKGDSDILYFYLARIFEKKIRQMTVLKFLDKNEHTFYAKLESIVSKDSNGDIHHCKTAISDITELKKAEIALRKSESEKLMILDNTSELILYQDTLLNIVWANKAAEKSVNVEPNDLIGKRCYEIWGQISTLCLNCPVVRALKTGITQEGEITHPDWQNLVY